MQLNKVAVHIVEFYKFKILNLIRIAHN